MNAEIAATPPPPRIVIVSNRLPVVVGRDAEGRPVVGPGSGGLVTALAPVLRDRGGVWVGWPGTEGPLDEETARLLGEEARRRGFRLEPVMLTAQQRDDFYLGCSNQVLWPLFHDLLWHINVEPRYWKVYCDTNRLFARTVAGSAAPDDFVWVHDYHLIQVARELRALGARQRLGFFLHIPFPPLDIFVKLPWREQALADLLTYDLVGFQTPRDRRNFVQCCRALLPGTAVRGKGQVATVVREGRETRVGVFPIGIDYHEFARGAGSPGVGQAVAAIRAALPVPHVVLGVDRLDYTKGIPKRLRAFRTFLEEHPELHGQVTFVQVVVPSRIEVHKYLELRTDIERLVSRINGTFSRAGWVPVHYLFQNLDRTELLAWYRAADVALVTPLKDGMNLVAKEFCACNRNGNAVLILSEFAGAAAQMGDGALLVNPYDQEGTAEALHRALTMSQAERRARMHRLRRGVRRHDVYDWVERFLRASVSKELDDFPLVPSPVQVPGHGDG